LGEDENALLGTEDDATFGAGILMGMATLGPVQVTVKTEVEEEGLSGEGVEQRNGVAEQVNGDVPMKEEDAEFLDGFQRKVIDGNTEYDGEDLLMDEDVAPMTLDFATPQVVEEEVQDSGRGESE